MCLRGEALTDLPRRGDKQAVLTSFSPDPAHRPRSVRLRRGGTERWPLERIEQELMRFASGRP